MKAAGLARDPSATEGPSHSGLPSGCSTSSCLPLLCPGHVHPSRERTQIFIRKNKMALYFDPGVGVRLLCICQQPGSIPELACGLPPSPLHRVDSGGCSTGFQCLGLHPLSLTPLETLEMHPPSLHVLSNSSRKGTLPKRHMEAEPVYPHGLPSQAGDPGARQSPGSPAQGKQRPAVPQG